MVSNVVLKGSLSYIGIGELIQLLGGNGSTGIIRLTSMYADEPGYVFLDNGNPINAQYKDKNGITALNSFFGWIDAQFEFSEEKVSTETLIKKGRMEIILDGLRMVDDGIIEMLGASPVSTKTDDEVDESSDLPLVKGPLIDFIGILDEEEFLADTQIVQQDKYGKWLWVILQGHADVIREMPDGIAPIIRLSEGAFIGTISSILKNGIVRSATVKAATNVQLGVLDYDRIFEELSHVSDEMKGVLLSIENRLKQTTEICSEAVFHNVKLVPGFKGYKAFMKQDKDDDRVLIIKEGKATIARSIDKSFLKLSTLSAGDIIGHIPFLSTPHEPHSASVFVNNEFTAEEIDLSQIREEYDGLSHTTKNMIQCTANCISITTSRIVGLMTKKKSDD